MRRRTTTAMLLSLLLTPLLAQEDPAKQASEPPASKETTPAAENKDIIFTIMERRFLNGKITAKQYQRFLLQYKPPAVLPEITNTPAQKRVLQPPPKQAPPAPKTADPEFPYTAERTPRPEVDPPESDTSGEKKPSLAEVEARMNALIKSREERARKEARGESTDPLSDPTRSKRDRLNALLRLYIQEKITEEDYRSRRDKIIAEPEAKPEK